MPKDDISLREAGAAINAAGLADDVRRIDEKSLGDRRAREDARDDERPLSRRERARRKSREAEERLEDDEDDFEDDEGQNASSNRKSGEPDDDEPDDDGSDDEDEEGSESEDDEDDSGEGESRESVADPMEQEFEVKVNGQKQKVTLKELLSEYPKAGSYYQKTEQLASYRRQLNANHSKVAQDYAQRLQGVQGLHQRVEQLLVGDVNSAYMAELKAKSPQEWMIARQTLQDRIDAVRGTLAKIYQEQERHRQDFTKISQHDLSEHLQRELDVIERHIPDWRTDGKVRLGSYLTRNGFSQEEVQGVQDSRMLLVAEKARKYDELMAEKAQTSSKKERKRPPKNARSKGGQMQRQPTKERKERGQFAAAKHKAAKTGSMRDAGRAIGMLIK